MEYGKTITPKNVINLIQGDTHQIAQAKRQLADEIAAEVEKMERTAWGQVVEGAMNSVIMLAAEVIREELNIKAPPIDVCDDGDELDETTQMFVWLHMQINERSLKKQEAHRHEPANL